VPPDPRTAAGTAVVEEFRRVSQPPYEAPMVVAINGALMTILWFLLPPDLVNLVFSEHRPYAYAAVLVAWMVADVPATNVLGSTPDLALSCLDDPVALRRQLWAKDVVLWALVCPLGAIIAFSGGLGHRNPASLAVTVISILILPFGALSAADWVGVLWPYRPRPLRERWEQRHQPRQLLRWITLVLLPYGWVPLVLSFELTPMLLIWRIGAHGWDAPPSTANLLLGSAAGWLFAALCYYLGRLITNRMVASRRERLRVDLANPAFG